MRFSHKGTETQRKKVATFHAISAAVPGME